MLELRSTLRPDQLRRLDAIVREREHLASTGFLLGVLAALLLAGRHPCVSLLALFGVQRAYYGLSPKTDWLVPELDRRDQREAWMRVYVGYKEASHLGVVAGVLAYALTVFAARRITARS